MKFSQELQELFLKGAQVVYSQAVYNYSSQYKTQVHLLRMPKGMFIKDERQGELYKNNAFEFVKVENYRIKDLFQVSGYISGDLRSVKKEIRLEKE
tara:strand:- start:620 stop:907 length:288 start_codon:yes stop_codon:yes gene_type:complete